MSASDPRYCCHGCESVHDLLMGQGLSRYYAFERSRTPAAEAPTPRDLAWLDPLIATAEAQPGSMCGLSLDLGGIHCAACVWLIEELFHRKSPSGAATVNPALGKVELTWRRGELDPRAFAIEVERFGYRFGPDRKRAAERSSSLTLRLGICTALTINVMLFSISFYAGLGPAEAQLFSLFSRLVLVLSTLVVLIGGSVFFLAAWRGLRAGVLHLDVPIAVGILLAYGASMVQARSGRGDHAYLDTLCVFVTLMLVGRWLQERLLERNRRLLLEDDAIERMTVRRRAGEHLEHIPVAEVRRGDVLVIAPAALVPVDLRLIEARAAVTTDWITGEPDVRSIGRDELVSAGACNAGRAAFAGVAETAFADSLLPRLLRAGGSARGTRKVYRRLWSRFAQVYVAAVLGLAALAFGMWWLIDARRAVDVTVALLVVTCPCAVGIAGPLAYELTLGRLRRRGLFVRTGDLLDKLTRVRKVLFDKTGTLTLGSLTLVDESALAELTATERDRAYTMSSRSNHPASRCLAEALARSGARVDHEAMVTEEPGRGLELVSGAVRYRLGSVAWVEGGAGERGVTALSVDGKLRALFHMQETVRADARASIARLTSLGCEVYILSGDGVDRVVQVADALGVPRANLRAGLSPVEKAWQVEALDDEDTLFVGDGVNDALAFERALVAGTPAIDRPVLPSKADFFILGDGVEAVAESIVAARRLRSIVRRNLAVAITYNTVAVAACLAGVMTPLRAAVLMPVSSLVIIAATVYSLSEARWRS